MSEKRIKALLIVPVKSMSEKDIKRVERLCGVVVVESDSPDDLRFLQPPMDADVPAQAQAALSLMRRLVDNTWPTNTLGQVSRSELINWFTRSLMAWNEQPEKTKHVKGVKS